MSSEPGSVTTAIDRALWHIYNVEELMANFNTDKQEAVHQRLLELSSTLNELDSLADTSPEVQVEAPARLLAWIDAGKDPDEFVKNLFTETLSLHQSLRGKVNALMEGKELLVGGMEQQMPTLHQEHKAALAASSTPPAAKITHSKPQP